MEKNDVEREEGKEETKEGQARKRPVRRRMKTILVAITTWPPP